MLKHVGAINTEQYDKLSIKCAFVCSLYINYTIFVMLDNKTFRRSDRSPLQQTKYQKCYSPATLHSSVSQTGLLLCFVISNGHGRNPVTQQGLQEF
jgi:hypothetical protein